jgi:hypothetical protein
MKIYFTHCNSNDVITSYRSPSKDAVLYYLLHELIDMLLAYEPFNMNRNYAFTISSSDVPIAKK